MAVEYVEDGIRREGVVEKVSESPDGPILGIHALHSLANLNDPRVEKELHAPDISAPQAS